LCRLTLVGFFSKGWTYNDAPDEKFLKKAGDGIRDEIKKVHGKKYTSEREIDLYKASGTASDWFYDEEVQEWLPDRRLYAYTIELRPSAEECKFMSIFSVLNVISNMITQLGEGKGSFCLQNRSFQLEKRFLLLRNTIWSLLWLIPFTCEMI
jgi:hypothetical protein